MAAAGTMVQVGGSPQAAVGGGRRRWKILHLVSTFAVKTDTKWLLQIAEYLDRARFELSAACFHAGGEIRERLAATGIETHNLDVPLEFNPAAVLRARRLIARVRPDVVHTHLLRADLWGGIAARWAGVPVVVSTAYAIGEYRRAVRRRSDRLLDAVCRTLPTNVLAVCDAVRNDCIDRLGLDPRQVVVIRTGVDPPKRIDDGEVARLRREWSHAGGPLIVTVARLSYEKGLHELIDAAARLVRTHPTARWVIVGDGPDRLRLQRRATDRGVAGVIRFAGFRPDVWPATAAADVCCLPSLMEGMPNALLEAMALGKPVVASGVGGIPEAVESGRSGLLVPPGDPVALAAAVGRLLGDPTAAVAYGRAARAVVEERFQARDVVARYGEWYQSLIEPWNESTGHAKSRAAPPPPP